MSTALTIGARRVPQVTFAWRRSVRTLTRTTSYRFPSASKKWTCPDCALILSPNRPSFGTFDSQRTFSVSLRRSDGPQRTPFNPKPPESAPEPVVVNTTADLPSKTDQRRWQFSRRMAHLMDSILARASVAGQHINVYTGTDYSGIEAIKKEINELEEKVDECHDTIDAARSAHHEAHAKQAGSQKEIVSLLERKASWSPEDLERYMTLVRSEHLDEQAVQAAKDGLSMAERDLENARADLERMERKQYHEEQIWSDTIRRNSTWVTFGLMGLNIILLLAQIAIFEPYRRRKIVKEVKASLNERAAAITTASIEKQIDETVEPEILPAEVVEKVSVHGEALDPSTSVDLGPGGVVVASGEVVLDESIQPSNTGQPLPRLPNQPQNWSDRWEAYKENLQDLFSERIIQVKKVDLTTTALQGAATGVAAIGLLFVLWRPK